MTFLEMVTCVDLFVVSTLCCSVDSSDDETDALCDLMIATSGEHHETGLYSLSTISHMYRSMNDVSESSSTFSSSAMSSRAQMHSLPMLT